jgi:hypothetical protein
MLARLAPIAFLLAACSDPAELPESMRLTGVAGTAMGDAPGQCDYLNAVVGASPAAVFEMNVRDRSSPATCTCYTDLTGRSPCSFDGNRMTCTFDAPTPIVWSVDFDAEAMTAAVTATQGQCTASIQATVAELTAN